SHIAGFSTSMTRNCPRVHHPLDPYISGVGKLSYGLTPARKGSERSRQGGPAAHPARQGGFFVVPTPRPQDEEAARPPHRHSLPCLRSSRRCGRQREEPVVDGRIRPAAYR